MVEQYVQIMSFGRIVGVNASRHAQTTQIKAKEEILIGFETYISLILSVKETRTVNLFWDLQDVTDLGVFNSSNDTESKPLSLNTKEGKKDFLRKRRGVEQLVEVLPVLLDFWIEASELVFMAPEIGQSQNLNICFLIIRVLRLIWNQVGQDSAEHKLLELSLLIAKHIQPQFPFGKEKSSRDMAVFPL